MIDGISSRRGFAGKKGWPKSFGEPELFLDRVAPALKWSDLAGTERPDKPWLNGLPRIIFLNDMGDTFDKKLPLHWLAPLLPLMAQSPHQFLLLTKRPSRAVEFSERFPFPTNFWIGTTVTSNATKNRVEQLRRVQGGCLKFVSFEPMWSDIDADAYEGIHWAIFGGESGDNPVECSLSWIQNGVDRARAVGCVPFVKQLGGLPIIQSDKDQDGNQLRNPKIVLRVEDSHGGNWDEWPEELRVREMPKLKPTTLL